MIYRDLVKQAATVSGTGAFTLGAAVSGFQTMNAGRVIGDQIKYAFRKGLEWENGTGTLAAGGTLTRAPSASSNAGALVNFTAGTGEILETVTGSDLTVFDRNASARVYVLSKVGAVPDADVSIGSTSFGTSSQDPVQAVLDLASPTNPIKVIVDGGFSVTGLRVKGNTHIHIMTGCGFVLRTGSNKSLIENYNISFDPLVRTDKNIKITGDLATLNGNRGLPGPGAVHGLNNFKGDGTIGLVCIVRMYGVENLEVSGISFVNQPSYAFHQMNCKNATEFNNKYDVGTGPIINNDGSNTGGHCENVVKRDLVLRAQDDPLSVSPDDVWRTPGGFTFPYYPQAAMGALKHVLIENIQLKSIVYAVRLMSGASLLDDVVIRNIRGTTGRWGILLDNRQVEGDLVGAVGTGNIGTVIIDVADIVLSASEATAVVYVRSSVKRLVLRNLRRDDFAAGVPQILVNGSGVTIGELVVEGYRSNDVASNQVVQHISIIGATVNRLTLKDIEVRRSVGNGSNLVNVGAGTTIRTIQANLVHLDGIDSLVYNPSGTITRINADNIVHLNPSSGKATFDTASTVGSIKLSNYEGTLATNGTFTVKGGDALPATVDATPPTITSVTVADATPTQVDIVFSETMTITDVPALTAVTFTGGTARTTSALAWLNANTLRATVSVALAAGEAPALNITQPAANKIRDAATTPNPLVDVTGRAITNNVGVTNPVAVTFAGDANLVQSGNTKALTGAAATANAYYAYLGSVPTAKLALGTNGYVGLTYVDSAGTNVELGFKTGVAGMPSAGLAFVGGALVPLDGGVYVSTPRPALVAGRKYIVRVVGTVITLESSPDGTTWTVIYTYIQTRTVDLNVTMRLYNTSVASFVQGVNLS